MFSLFLHFTLVFLLFLFFVLDLEFRKFYFFTVPPNAKAYVFAFFTFYLVFFCFFYFLFWTWGLEYFTFSPYLPF